MNKRTLKDLGSLENKVVLLRVDFNVPINNGEITDVNRIVGALPTINYLIEKNAKIVLLSHLGRIASDEDKSKYTLAPVAKKLSEMMNKNVKFIHTTRGSELEEAISSMNSGEIVMMENTRYEDFDDEIIVSRESKNDPELGAY
jgi:phosphoglycerate kinase